MPIAVDRAGLDLAIQSDGLGREGCTQEQIADRLGFQSKWQLRTALSNAGYELAAENRVRFRATGSRLSELIEAGELVPATEEVAV